MSFLYIPGEDKICTDKKVILSTDNNMDYYFYAPINSKIWVDHLGFKPIIPIVGNEVWFKANTKQNYVLRKILESGGDVVFIEEKRIKERFGNYQISMFAQISRLCSSYFTDENDICVTSDVDMLTIDKNYINSFSKIKDITCFYANGYSYKRFPMCYIFMKSKVWKRIIGLDDFFSLFDGFSWIIKDLNSDVHPDFQWGWDEDFLFRRLKNLFNDIHFVESKILPNPGFKGLDKVPGSLPEGRLDRSNWKPEEFLKDNLIDIHCKRPGYIFKYFESLINILKIYLDSNLINWIIEYHKTFMKVGI